MPRGTRNIVRLHNPTDLTVRITLELDGAIGPRNIEVPPHSEVAVPAYYMRTSAPLDRLDRAMVAIAVGSWAVLHLDVGLEPLAAGDYVRAGLFLAVSAYLWSLMRRAWRATR